MKQTREVFLYSAPEDKPVLQELLKQLHVFEQRGLITLKHNHALAPGADPEREMASHVARAAYIFLLMSPDFMNERYGYGEHVRKALERHRQGKTRVIPVILRPINWKAPPFDQLKALPRDEKPLPDSRRGRENALYEIAQEMQLLLEKEGVVDVAPLSGEVTDIAQTSSPADQTLISFLTQWGALSVLIGATFGLNLITWLRDDPRLWVFLQSYPWLVAGVLLITGGIPLLLVYRTRHPRFTPGQNSSAVREDQRPSRPVIRRTLTLFVPALTTTLFLSLLLLVLLRPAWCPTQLCAASAVAIPPGPDDIHDTNLDFSYVTQQSNFFVLPNGHAYTIKNLPRDSAALNSDDPQMPPYRLVFSLTNLHRTGYSIFIDQVDLVIVSVPILAHPLHVWSAPSLAYTTAPYSVTYRGEEAGSVLPFNYHPAPDVTNVHQQLKINEKDTLDLQISPEPHIQADVKFQVRVTYRMANEGDEHSLILAHIFEVVFANADNWHVQTF